MKSLNELVSSDGWQHYPRLAEARPVEKVRLQEGADKGGLFKNRLKGR